MGLPTFLYATVAATVMGLACLDARPAPTQVRVVVDSVRVLRDLATLADDSMEGRAPGSGGSARARTFIERSLNEAGARPFGGSFGSGFSWSGGEGHNVVAWIPGASVPTEYIALTAHYDHLGIRDGEIYNGADDNASGVAALLAASRALVKQPLRRSLLIAVFDAEEAGMRGSRAFVASPPVAIEAIVLNINLDMVSRSSGLLWAAGASHTPALTPVLEAIAADAPVTLRLGHDRAGAAEGDDWTGASDHAAFHEVDIPFVYFGVEDHPDYHRPTDDVERVDAGDYLAAVRTILAAIVALDAALPLETGVPR